MGTYFSDEAITCSMIEGLKEGMRRELKDRILKDLEADIENVVCAVVNKMNFNANQMQSPFDSDRKIRLDVLFMHTNETKLIHENKMVIVNEK